MFHRNSVLSKTRLWAIGLALVLAASPAAAADLIDFTGSATDSGTIKVKIKLVDKTNGQDAGECEVSVGIVIGESDVQKAEKVKNALNDGGLPCAALVGATRSGSQVSVTPDNADHEIQSMTVEDKLDKSKVRINGKWLLSAVSTIRLDGLGLEAPAPALCSVELPGGFFASASVPMAGLPGDVIEQQLAALLQDQAVNAWWDGDLRIDLGPMSPVDDASVELDVSNPPPGSGLESSLSIDMRPVLTTPVEEASWGRVKTMFR